MECNGKAETRLLRSLSHALRVRGMFHVILLLFTAQFRLLLAACVCVSCVRVACRRGILSLRRRRRRRPCDKVLSYDLLKCPNATITRDYYKCIPRVQRTQNRTPQFATPRRGQRGNKSERERQKRERAVQLEACRGSQGNKLFWPPTNE